MSRLLLTRFRQVTRSRLAQTTIRQYASEAPETVAPMLTRLRDELKTSMRAKDKERTNVIKSVLDRIKYTEKEGKPMNTDEKIRKHLLRTAAAQKATAEGFAAASRDDLRDKELAQVAILEGYANEIKVVSLDVLREAIPKAINVIEGKGFRVNIGSIAQTLRSKDGPLSGETFDYDQAIDLMKQMKIGGN